MKLILAEIRNAVEKGRAEKSARFFKTKKGCYGYGDIFLGVRNGELRRIAKKHWQNTELRDIKKLLCSAIHEERLVSVLLLVEKYKHGDENGKMQVFNFYVDHAKSINSWDLVDLSSWKIVGEWLRGKKDRSVLVALAKSRNLWERRIAIVSTFAFIRRGEIRDTLDLAKILRGDSHDLIHKAVGWMLREVGKRDNVALKKFLKKNYTQLSRTTIRYAIERFEKTERIRWLRLNVL